MKPVTLALLSVMVLLVGVVAATYGWIAGLIATLGAWVVMIQYDRLSPGPQEGDAFRAVTYAAIAIGYALGLIWAALGVNLTNCGL